MASNHRGSRFFDDDNANLSFQRSKQFSKSLPNLSIIHDGGHAASQLRELAPLPTAVARTEEDGSSVIESPTPSGSNGTVITGNPTEPDCLPSSVQYWVLQYSEEKVPPEDESNNAINTPIPRSQTHKKTSSAMSSYADVHRKYILDAADNPFSPPTKRPPRRLLDLIILRIPGTPAYPIHYVDGRLVVPLCRTRFICKVMFAKFIKWLIATAFTLCSFYIPHLRGFAKENVWAICIPGSVYLISFTMLRSFPGILYPACCAAALCIYTLCLCAMGCLIYCAFETTLIPTIMITLTLFYAATSVLSGTAKMDLTKDNVVPGVLLLDMIFSLLGFLIAHLIIERKDEFKIIEQFGSIWFPSVMLVQAVTLMEMAELKAIVDGIRINLGTNDWMIVGAYLF